MQVRKLEAFKNSLLTNLAEEAGAVLPASATPDPLPDSDQLVLDILAHSKPEALPARPSLVHIEMCAHDGPLSTAGRIENTGISSLAVAAADAADGNSPKEFFKDARNRLPYEGFHEFLQVRDPAIAGGRCSCPQGRVEASCTTRAGICQVVTSSRALIDRVLAGHQGPECRQAKP